MKARCSNPSNQQFGNYGGRGIGFDPSWETFDAFLSEMGERPKGLTLERNDNSLGYSKANCRWATMNEQSLNKRNNVRYLLHGKSQTLSEWSRELGIKRLTLRYRAHHGIELDAPVA